MHYIIYKTTNLINGKFYIGKHQTNELNDGYIGSGKLLKRAINKYGLDNFKTEIIETCPTEDHMNLAEKIYVITDSEVSYNLCSGGKGGFGYINENIPIDRIKRGRTGGLKGGASLRHKIHTDVSYKKRYVSFANRLNEHNLINKGNNKGMLGKKHSASTKHKMSEIAKKRTGEKNYQFGSKWVTDGVLSKKIYDDNIPIGWKLGRAPKQQLSVITK